MTGPGAARSLPRTWLVTAVVLAAGIASLLLPGGSPAVALPRVPSGEAPSDQRAVQLLRVAYEAGRSLSYSGTAFVGAGDTFVQVRIRHLPGTGTYVAPVRSAPAGPDARQDADAMVQPDADGTGPDLDPLRLLRAHYRLAYAGTDEIAGRLAHVVRALRDGGSVAATFWVDERTGLVLAREAYDATGARYEQVMFTDLSVQAGGHGTGSTTESPSQLGALTVGGGPQQLGVLAVPGGAPRQLDRLRAAGWAAPAALPGGFELYDARVVGAGRAAVLHLSYSDGLFAVSVFEQRGRLAAGAMAGWRQATMAGRTVYVDGSSPQRLAWQGNDTVFAVLGDAAATRVADAVSGLPHGEARDGVLDRMARGFDRLGSWIDPFD